MKLKVGQTWNSTKQFCEWRKLNLGLFNLRLCVHVYVSACVYVIVCACVCFCVVCVYEDEVCVCACVLCDYVCLCGCVRTPHHGKCVCIGYKANLEVSASRQTRMLLPQGKHLGRGIEAHAHTKTSTCKHTNPNRQSNEDWHNYKQRSAHTLPITYAHPHTHT